ncbi:peptidase domain-containing ABC transporter [Cohnella suwonensis]|uniref:Peptidase domain-containing ABC transporter n=1 Tax=Cohnella suwonensis TaxID=696072 RepID=A0ABW0LQM3_9BACL
MTERYMEYLHRVPMLNVLATGEKRLLAEQMKEETYRMGQTVVGGDRLPEAFYLIVSGQARKIGFTADGKESNLGLLQPGEHFGEHVLLSEVAPPQLIVRASTELQVLTIGQQQFKRIIAEYPALDKYFRDFISSDILRSFLKNNTVFTRVDHSAIRSLLDRLTIHSYEAMEYLVQEGEAGDAFYIVKSGTASVEIGASAAVVNRLYPGDFFGELALLTGEPRKASIRAEGPVTVFRLAKSDFDDLIRRYPVILESIRRISAHYAGESVETASASEAQFAPSEFFHPTPSQARRPFRFRMPSLKRNKYPAILQQNEMDCGPTCLTMIARYYGMDASVNRMRERCNVGAEGASMLALSETAESLGFDAQGLKTTTALLSELQTPFIAHWNGNHFIIVYEVKKDEVIMADPAVGFVDEIPLEEFNKHWNGYVITLKPTERLLPINDHESLWSRYFAYFQPHKKLIASTLALAISIELIFLVFPVMSQQIFDRVLEDVDLPLLHILLIAMFVLACFNMLSIAVRQSLVGKLAYVIDRSMLESFYRHLFSLPFTYFIKRTSGDIITRVYENERIRKLLTDQAVQVLLDGLTMIAYGSLMVYYHPGLALISFSMLPIYLAFYAYLLPKLRRNFLKQQLAEGESQTQIVEAVGAIATVKGLSMESAVRQKLMQKLQSQLLLRLEGNRLDVLINAGTTGLRMLSNIALLYFGSMFVIEGELSIGKLVAFTVLFTSFLYALEAISQQSGELSEARISMERLNDVYESTMEHPDPSQMRKLPSLRGHIRFENVSFRYSSGGKMILQNLNVEIQPGQTIALVGRSGSGKSTIAQLLLKLLEPTSGSIYIDGYPLRGVHAASIRRQVGMVQQEAVIFRGTVRDNIALHGEDAAFGEVERTAQLAGAHEFIESLPLGYDTMIGEGGIRLSGGQRQRIVIARALLHNPRILIFDEATSALDTESERIIQQNMETVLQNRTTLIIAHRLSTIRAADIILVLDQGIIAEAGTHEQLLAQKGMYHYLVHQQVS